MESYKNPYFQIIESYIKDIDEISRNNANFVKSLAALETAIVGAVSKDYLFDVVYQGLPIRSLHDFGWIYHHQAYRISFYCIGLSAKQIAFYGLKSNAKNDKQAKPPRRLDTLFVQCANLICLISQEVSGATSLNDLSTIAASYLFEEEKKGRKYTDYELKNLWQTFLYNINLPFRSGNSPFSNITLDFGKPPYNLRNEPVIYAGKVLDYTYSDIPSEYYDRINKAFIDAMSEGDALGNPFTFPLITVNVDEDFDYDNKVWKYFLEKVQKFGGFYIQNYYQKPFIETPYKEKNQYIKPLDKGTIYSNCCRMMFNTAMASVLDEQKETLNSTKVGFHVFGSISGVGGVGVININLARLIWLSACNIRDLFRVLDYLFEVAQKALQRKREWIRKHYTDLYPYLSFYQPSDKTFYNIFSVVGVHEGLQAYFKGGIYNKKGRELAHKIAKWIAKKIEYMMNRDKVLCNLEFAPSENAAPRMAKYDIIFAKELAKAFEEGEDPISKLSDTFLKDDFIREWTRQMLQKHFDKLFKKK